MEKQELTVLKIEDLRPFPGNPFHLVEDEQLMELSESIKGDDGPVTVYGQNKGGDTLYPRQF